MELPISLRMDARLITRIATKKARLDQLRPLPAAVVARLADDMRVLLTYHSNAIEGNTLSLYETKMVIEEGVTIRGQPLRYYLEARNHADALDQVQTLADAHTPIKSDTIRFLHQIMMDRVLDDAGQWRRGDAHIRGASFTPPHPHEVPRLMNEWTDWIARDDLPYSALQRAIVAHVLFEAIHPFADGNGRVGRLLLNLMLMQAGYPPALLPQEWRVSYLHGLHEAQTQGNYRAICNVLGRAVEQALDRYLESISASDTLLVPLRDAAAHTGERAEHLAWLIRQGRLPGVKQGRNWHVSIEAVRAYQREVASRSTPRGRPPKERHDTR